MFAKLDSTNRSGLLGLAQRLLPGEAERVRDLDWRGELPAAHEQRGEVGSAKAERVLELNANTKQTLHQYIHK